jgi:hypothetical protein
MHPEVETRFYVLVFFMAMAALVATNVAQAGF